MLTGFRDQIVADGRLAPGAVGFNYVMCDDCPPEFQEMCMIAGGDCGVVLKLKVADGQSFVHDLTCQQLDPELCKAARQKEREYVRGKGLWVKRTIKDCWDRTNGPPVTVRWVETN